MEHDKRVSHIGTKSEEKYSYKLKKAGFHTRYALI